MTPAPIFNGWIIAYPLSVARRSLESLVVSPQYTPVTKGENVDELK
jgi:hypothetical protein